MEYTHYYYVAPVFDKNAFEKAATDFKKMTRPLRHLGVVLADEGGEGSPTIRPTEICFNGVRDCGHAERKLGITWPSTSASGVVRNGVDTTLQEITKTTWYAGASLEARACGGDCSYESFCMRQKHEPYSDERPMDTYSERTNRRNPNNMVGKYRESVKTAYRPYDLAINVCLIIAKHHLKDGILIKSDGTIDNWQEGMHLCQHFLGYGGDFALGK